ncbi:beta-glucosidase [Burkholderia sp. TSV86]|uniref:beta-glucosidase n=1 Tax=Burkholderia sp. TSV86 TaxID=1385594 RepID=UPI000ACAD131
MEHIGALAQADAHVPMSRWRKFIGMLFVSCVLSACGGEDGGSTTKFVAQQTTQGGASSGTAAGSGTSSGSTGSASGSSSGSSTSSGSSATTPPAGTAAASILASTLPFFGVNGHYMQGGIYMSMPLNSQAMHVTDLGMRFFRQDVYIPEHIDLLVDKVMPALGTNVTVLPMISAYPYDDPSLHGAQPTEQSAYAYAYRVAAYAARRLDGIPVVEFGNEFDTDWHNAPVKGDGLNPSDFDNTTFPIWRGALRGSLDGWRSVDTQRKTILMANASTGWLNFGFLDALMSGTQPDGSTGHPKISPDAIQWHWYSNGGDFEHAYAKTGGIYNVLDRLKKTYNLPIVFTEVGVDPDNTDEQANAYIQKTIPELVAAKSQYNLIGFAWYEMYDNPNSRGPFGLITGDGTTKQRYLMLRSTVAAAKQGH